ncbi:PucR family transcriptional regulator [Parasporobacterium paucivorans]|uniref:PucR C-terminal helix-turn-helix domain-containing protein n=1 Tax=Parasporobacterium paucivorans DSM 15970 TaxID=1122934 RepID=A0A1M6GTQ2_9FIRM|nr:helix-turn-helix domain-containing protein [Parasporobacterium paucivorans]SHJ13272.1 PucR C-terminal helix-turn-helix domain-containing protein [Parasporobacterium paucivorans DSM 15970]
MRLNLTILEEELSKKYTVKSFLHEIDPMRYIGVQALEDDIIPLEQHILLIGAGCRNAAVLRGGYGVISLGEPDSRIIRKNECLILSEDIPLVKLFSEIQRIYFKYTIWAESLHEAVSKGAGLQELCDLSAEIFENPILVYDNNLFLLAISNDAQGLPVWDYDEKSGKRTLPLEVLNDFKLNEEFQQTMLTTGAKMCSENVIGYKVLYHNFWVNNFYAGRICINELKREITPGEYSLLEYFSNILEPVLQYSKVRQNERIKAFEQSLKDMLSGNAVNEMLLLAGLTDIGWGRNDRHFYIRIITEDRDSKTFSANYTCNQLENHFPHSFVFPYDQSILMIINLEKNRKELSILLSEIKMFLREGLFRAGISRVCSDFFRLREYFFQTALAVQVGEKRDPMYWYYYFGDYTIPAMFHEMTRNISSDIYCERGLFSLLKYDEEHGTQLYETLRTYLDCNMNITHTSEKMFIHRTTLMYRLERISSMVGADIKNPEERFRILLSYHLLDWTNGGQTPKLTPQSK